MSERYPIIVQYQGTVCDWDSSTALVRSYNKQRRTTALWTQNSQAASRHRPSDSNLSIKDHWDPNRAAAVTSGTQLVYGLPGVAYELPEIATVQASDCQLVYWLPGVAYRLPEIATIVLWDECNGDLSYWAKISDTERNQQLVYLEV